MGETSLRMTEPGPSPTSRQVQACVVEKAYGFWTRLSTWIAESYPKVFTPEWLYGGRKHGWYLRYKKSKSFCSLIPERNRCAILIVFGADERTKVAAMRAELTASTREAYDSATTFHDGKWLFLPVSNAATMRDVQQLLTAKRRIGKGRSVKGRLAAT